ncbi:MAG: DUF4339 domain-containing protein [Deltaproteobacteria bacterium]|nr:MAG: DUF4339 domain-containing protein [Deltaproteobacteria bacterium]
MNPPTRRIKAMVAVDRWLYRKDGSDYGPISTDELLEVIEQRKIDLTTPVCQTRDRRWGPAAEHAILRDYYEKCQVRWRAQALDTEAEAHARRLARARQHRRRFVTLVMVGGLVAAGLAAYIIWRLGQAQPLGMNRLARIPQVEVLPVVESPRGEPPRVALVQEVVVPRLSEPETYDTAGIAMEGDGQAPQTVSKMTFDEEGQVATIPASELQRVLDTARANLKPCAMDAWRRDSAFTGTRISFTVTPGALTGITVSEEVKRNAAFKACIKTALGRVSVPVYKGGDRRVTIPISLGN